MRSLATYRLSCIVPADMKRSTPERNPPPPADPAASRLSRWPGQSVEIPGSYARPAGRRLALLFTRCVSGDLPRMPAARSVSRIRRFGSPAKGPATTQAALRKGSEALAHGRWQEARTWFERALRKVATPQALEGLGTAAWWLDDGALVFKAREHAFQLYLQRGDRRGAGRLATALAGDYLQFRGEAAVARGWHRRAHRLLEGLRPAPEHGWLQVSEADLALASGGDPASVRRHAARAAAVGRSAGAVDLEMVALALEGLALVTEGKRAQGLDCLDEASAAAMSGEMTDRMAIGICCCYVVTACERIRDFDRAAQWCARLKDFCEATHFKALLGMCRAQYGGVLVWRGWWAEADTELTTAARQLAATRPAMQADALALDAGDAASAARLAERTLRRMPAANRTERAWALDILVRAQVTLQQGRGAAVLLDEVRRPASEIGTEPFQASASSTEGIVALAAGDAERARKAFEDAVDLYRRSHGVFEEARARVELARALIALGESASARAELRLAEQVFRTLGATWQVDHVASLLRDKAGAMPAVSRRDAGTGRLTQRELEVLRLIARGLSNKGIGRNLMVSEFTVKRHVANILTKLDLRSRAAAAAFAAQRGLL
jgi:DNA-binding NarL/FixJ family response regulator